MDAARIALLAFGLLVLAACQAPGPPSPTTIEASDSGVFVPTLRMTREEPRAYSEPSDVGRGGAFELSYFRGSGSDTQNLAASNQPIKLGGTNFSGPQQVRHDFALNWYELAARGRIFGASPDRALGAEFLFGAAVPRLAFRVSSSTAQASETFGAYGVVIGTGALWRLRPGTSTQVRYSYYRGLGGNDDLAHATRTEISLAQALARNLVARAGYMEWSLHVGRGTANNSDLNVKIRGPSLGLELVF